MAAAIGMQRAMSSTCNVQLTMMHVASLCGWTGKIAEREPTYLVTAAVA